MASAVLDARVSPGMPPISEVGVPSAPVGPTTAPELTATPVENIPVVIITDSTDGEPDSTEEVKTLVSRGSGEVERSALDAIPMQIMNRVSAPSRHRYYGQEVLNDAGEASTGPDGTDRPVLILDTTADAHNQRRPSLSISFSPSHSITHSSNTGMDEFLLISPTLSRSRSRSHSVRSVLSTRSPRRSVEAPDATPGERHPSMRDADVRLSMSTPTMEAGQPVPMFKAFPRLSPTSAIRSTRISAIGFVLAAALVLTALVYDIVESVGGR